MRPGGAALGAHVTPDAAGVEDMERWTVRGPLPSTLLRLHRHSFMHVLVMGGSDERRAAVALAFHRESPLRAGPFVRVDCAQEEPLLEAALDCWLSAVARHAAGNPLLAAERGTLFLDRVDGLGVAAQRRLLAFLRAVGSGACPSWAGRITAGSPNPVEEAVVGGRFLPALFDCLDKVRVVLGVARSGAPS